jgi:molybdopterin synthase sulfur carrier subunit
MGIRVKVVAYGVLKEILGAKEAIIEIEERNVRSLLHAILRKRGPALESDVEKICQQFEIIVNGRSIGGQRGLNSEIKDGDEIIFFPPVVGGLNRP